MKKITLGQDDLTVSKLCLGTMMMGSQNSKEEAFTLLDKALDSGINFFDTAEGYSIPFNEKTHGFSEIILGEWVKSRGLKNKVLIASKVTGRSKMSWLRAAKNPLSKKFYKAIGKETCLNKKNIDHAIHNSLKRLDIECIDLYQIHWPDRPLNKFGMDEDEAPLTDPRYIPIEETLDALAEHIQAGNIKAIGISNENAAGTAEYVRLSKERNLPKVASIQNAYSLVNRTFEGELQNICESNNIYLMPYSCLAMGYLSGKYQGDNAPNGSRKQQYGKAGLLNRYTSLEDSLITKYQNIADELELSLAELAIAFVNQQPFVGPTIIAATNTSQLEENINASLISLENSTIDAINNIHRAMPNPCP